MVALLSMLQSRRREIVELARRYGAHNVRVFGSTVRGADRPGSDIDFLVSFVPGRSLIDHAGLWLDLTELLGREVDVVNEAAIHPALQAQILAEAVPL